MQCTKWKNENDIFRLQEEKMNDCENPSRRWLAIWFWCFDHWFDLFEIFTRAGETTVQEKSDRAEYGAARRFYNNYLYLDSLQSILACLGRAICKVYWFAWSEQFVSRVGLLEACYLFAIKVHFSLFLFRSWRLAWRITSASTKPAGTWTTNQLFRMIWAVSSSGIGTAKMFPLRETHLALPPSSFRCSPTSWS